MIKRLIEGAKLAFGLHEGTAESGYPRRGRDS